MQFGRLIKQTEGAQWNSVEPIPHFCNNYRWEEIDENEFNNKLEIQEFSKVLRRHYDDDHNKFPLMCTLSIPCHYDLNVDYKDEGSKEYDRYCIEELGFEYLGFDEDGWPSLHSNLLTVKKADEIMSRIVAKMKDLNFPKDAKEHWGTGFWRSEQVRCPRCENICLIHHTYCPECGLLVGKDFVDWSTEELDDSTLRRLLTNKLKHSIK
jgi:hypothetical protein